MSSKTDNNMMPNRGYEVKLIKDDYGSIFAHLDPGKIKNQFVAQIDTGSSGGAYLTFPIKFLKKLKPELNCRLVKAGVGGVFGTQKSFISRLATLKLGNGLKVNNLPVEFFEFPNIVITNAFLSNFVVTINYPQSKMILEPNDEPFKTNIDSFGFFLKKDENGKIKIIGLCEGSSAQKKGLKVGDEIIGFNVNGTANKEDILQYLLKEEVLVDGDIEIGLQIINKSGKHKEVMLKKGRLLPES